MKQALASYISKRVKDSEVIGLGSGTTTEVAIVEIGRRIKSEGLRVIGVPTSLRTAQVAAENGIVVADLRTISKIDWAFDGADEVDPQLNLMKGRGAAMLQEKIVASLTDSISILVTEEKLVGKLGEKFAMPIEVISSAQRLVERELLKLGAGSVVLRLAEKKYGEVVSEAGNLVFDVSFTDINAQLQNSIKAIPGVVETGLFFGFKPEVIVASAQGLYSLAYKGENVTREQL